MFVTRQLAFGQNAEAHVSRSVMALLEGELGSAVRECEAALGLETRDRQRPTITWAVHCKTPGSPCRRCRPCAKRWRLRDNYPEAWANLGLVLRASGALDEAIKAYRKALDLAPALLGAS